MAEISPALYRAGEGEPVVLLHGFTGTWMHWRPVLGELVARYEVIAPTFAGHHGGPAPSKPLRTIDDAVDSVEEHLDGIGIGTAHFVGNSMGGALAISLAARGRARSVVALSPGGGWQPEQDEPERLVRFFTAQLKQTKMLERQLPRLLDFAPVRRLAFRDVLRFGDRIAPDDARLLIEGSLGCRVVDEVFAAMTNRRATPEGLENIEAPVLLAWAERDRILPMQTCSWRFRSEIPGNEFRVLPGVGHVPMWDNPKLVVDTISGWVDARVSAPVAAV